MGYGNSISSASWLPCIAALCLFAVSCNHPAAAGPKTDRVDETRSGIFNPKEAVTCASSAPAETLTDTHWKLIELNNKTDSIGAVENHVHMVLTVKDSRVTGFSGCNRFTGGYTVDNHRLQFSNMASTRMACPEGMELEQKFLSALEDTETFELSGDRLALQNADGKTLLRFKAALKQDD